MLRRMDFSGGSAHGNVLYSSMVEWHIPLRFALRWDRPALLRPTGITSTNSTV